MNIVIANRDPDCPESIKEIAPVALDLGELEKTAGNLSAIADAVALAAAVGTPHTVNEDQPPTKREARLKAEELFKAAAKTIETETGHRIGYTPPWAYDPKTKLAYDLWKRVVPMFVQLETVLDLKPKALVELLGANEANGAITRDMLYASLSPLAVKDLSKLLVKLGVGISLKTPVSIRSVQKQLIDRRDKAKQSDEVFSGHFVIRGDTAYVNHRPFKIQRGSSGNRRIRYGGFWLPLDVLKDICLATQGNR